MKRIIAIAIVVLLVFGGVVLNNVKATQMHDGRTVSGIEYDYDIRLVDGGTHHLLQVNLKLRYQNSVNNRTVRPHVELIPFNRAQNNIYLDAFNAIKIPGKSNVGYTCADYNCSVPVYGMSGSYYFVLECPVDGLTYANRIDKRITLLSREQIETRNYPVNDSRYGVTTSSSVSGAIQIHCSVNTSANGATLTYYFTDNTTTDSYNAKTTYKIWKSGTIDTESDTIWLKLNEKRTVRFTNLASDSLYYVMVRVWNHYEGKYENYYTTFYTEKTHDGVKGRKINGIQYWIHCYPKDNGDKLYIKITLIVPPGMPSRTIRPCLTLVPVESCYNKQTYARYCNLEQRTIPQINGSYSVAISHSYIVDVNMCGEVYYILECPIDGYNYYTRRDKTVTTGYFVDDDNLYPYEKVWMGCDSDGQLHAYAQAPINIGETSATLRGYYSSYGQNNLVNRTVYFAWGRYSGSYSSNSNYIQAYPNSNCQYTITNLQPNTTYHFAMYVYDTRQGEYVKSNDVSFKTTWSGGGGGNGVVTNPQLMRKSADSNSYIFVKNHEIIPNRTDMRILWATDGSQDVRLEVCYDVPNKNKTLFFSITKERIETKDLSFGFELYSGHRTFFESECDKNGYTYNPGNLYIRMVKYSASQNPSSTDILFKMPLKFGIQK